METQNEESFGSVSGSNRTSLVRGKQYRLMVFFESGLKDIYWAEKLLKRAIPRMIEIASSDDFIEALDNHYARIKMHIIRIEQIYKILGKKSMSQKYEAIEGLVQEGKSFIKKFEKGTLRDAAIISAAQKIERYETAAYDKLLGYAKALNLHAIVKLLEQIQYEERADNMELDTVYFSRTNVHAVN